MKALISLILAGVCLFGQTPPTKKSAPVKKSTATKSTTARKAAPAAKHAASSARVGNPALWTKQAPAEYRAKLTTTKGDIVIDVHRDWAPRGADRFYNMVRSGYLNDASFYRVVPNFIVQFGAAASPKVEAAWNTPNMKLRDDPVKQSNKRGTITFATSGPNSRTTEMFINLRDNANLNAMGFAPFGEVVQGMEVVDQLYSGYGDMQEMQGRGPSQTRVQTQGKAYLDKQFPQLDSIKSATIMPAEPAAARQVG